MARLWNMAVGGSTSYSLDRLVESDRCSYYLFVCGKFASKGFLQDGLFEFFEGSEFLAVNGFKILDFRV